MRFSKIVVLFFFCFEMQIAAAQQQDSVAVNRQVFQITPELTYSYKAPKTWDMFRFIPQDLYDLGKFTVQKENLKWDGLALGSTLVILPYDQKLIEDSGKLGERLGGWDKPSHYKRILGLEVIPTSISSAFYYIGNGNTTLLLSGFFYAVGKIGPDDYRALTTANELVEVLVSVGITTQTIKRMSGRQSPLVAIRDGNDGGAWHPFPSFAAYQSTTPNFDAMPSGHMATYFATLMVIATNYSEYKWIKPVGYTLGGALAFNMMSGKVHWASDYPLAVLIGCVIGKNIAERRIVKTSTALQGAKEKKTTFNTQYNFNRIYNTNVVGATITF
jgi:membrane-associated phospholipid phosphatase